MKIKAKPSFLSLDKKLLAVVLIVNILFTLAWSFTTSTLQQKDESENQTKELQYIEAVILPAVANSVWNVDQEQTRVQLQGVLVNPRVVGVRIQELGSNDKSFVEIGKSGDFSEIKEMSYDLKSPVSEGQHTFARLILYTTLDPVMARLKSEAIRYFVSEALETLILSLLILYAFRVLVLTHLAQFSNFFKENPLISRKTTHFPMRKGKRFRDEIDNLVEVINLTIDESKKYQTEIVDLKDRAEKANQAKSLFLASINHELRTPLNAILGVTDLLPESIPDKNEMQQLLDIQKRSGLHLLHLVDEILDFSKIEAGEVKIEEQPMDIRKALETCKMIMEGPVKDRGNRMEFLVDPNFPESICGDLNRINQIIINLVSNANKFTDHGLITVQIRRVGKDYEIIVRDTGKGIPADKLEEIFLPFRQLEDQPNQTRKGTGIGLSITKRLIGFMKGEIHVDSKVGLGSIFRITLPLQILEPSVKVAPKPKEPTPNEPRRKIKLLVVEDTPEIQMLIQAYLKGTEVDLTFAENGQEGVQKFKSDDPSVILMDLQMPVMNGFEATQKIRELEEHLGNHHVRIFALTALA
ncbi:MAG: ATP-binding response regulator, partial [Pseudobdellovibrionaceae bacterium]